ncbi:fumarylacetoacetate hydrolase family protein [Caballeronia hypogeia]|uniref:fumarylacetoacetate hydrolase family protein n=1 Tax=Caballeronia hypogeia TaxID=1777140 RepID=UPI0012FDDD32|nr:fumarylacetoacetate hydrolase family protein [Caballeronia hypogeia]
MYDFKALSDGEWPTLRGAIAGRALGQFRSLVASSEATFQLQDVSLQTVIPDTTTIFCSEASAGADSGKKRVSMHARREVVIRLASTLVGHGNPLVRPADSEQFEFRGRLAVVIGRSCRRVPAELAIDHVVGYAPFVETTVREWLRPGSSSTPAINFPLTCGIGPWMKMRESPGEEATFEIATRLNGSEVSRQPATEFEREIADSIAYCSAFTTLQPGDVLVVGGRGRREHNEDPTYLKPGDNLELEIANVGTLFHPVIDEVR